MGFEFCERFYTLIKFLFIVAGLLFQAESVAGQITKPAPPDSVKRAPKILPHDAWLGKDKLDHAMMSAGSAAAQFYLFHQELDWKRPKSRQLAAGSTLIIGAAKEIYDRVSRRGTPSWKDLLADVVGIGVALALVTK